jgi:hypothetical protein
LKSLPPLIDRHTPGALVMVLSSARKTIVLPSALA